MADGAEELLLGPEAFGQRVQPLPHAVRQAFLQLSHFVRKSGESMFGGSAVEPL